MKKRIPIEYVSASALAEHAKLLNLDGIRANMGAEAIIAKLGQAGFPTKYIEIDDPDEVEQDIQRQAPSKRERHTPGKRMMSLIIATQEVAGGSEPVWVSHNGVGMFIPRAREVIIDAKYFECLDHAVQHIAETDEDSKITGYRKVHLYPFSLLWIEDPLSVEEKAKFDAAAAKALAANAEAVAA